MDRPERVFAISQEGIYNEVSRPSSHHTIGNYNLIQSLLILKWSGFPTSDAISSIRANHILKMLRMRNFTTATNQLLPRYSL